MRIDLAFADEVIAEALRCGADQAEVYLKSSRKLSIEIKKQYVDSLTSSLSLGYSLRIIKNGRIGLSYSRDLRDIDFVVNSAIGSSDYPDEDSCNDLPEGTGISDAAIFDPVLGDISEDDAIKMIMSVEKSAYAEDVRIKKVRKASGSFSLSETAIVNSKGVRSTFSGTSCIAQIMAVAEEGCENQSGWDFDGSRFLGEICFEDIGRNAARNALRLLGSRKMTGGRTSVILDNSVTVDFLGLLASSLSAEAVQKGKSLLSERLGDKVISPSVNIVDSGLLSGKLGSSPSDAEGVPAQSKVLIQEGVLQSYLYNTYTARKDKTVSTGNAVRGGFSSLPGVGISNLYLEPASSSATVSQNALFSKIARGLYITDAMGVHTANPVSGDFSVGVSGILIENGEVSYPVKEAVLSGNVLDFFNRIEAIGNDLKFYGNIGGPSLIISGVDISA